MASTLTVAPAPLFLPLVHHHDSFTAHTPTMASEAPPQPEGDHAQAPGTHTTEADAAQKPPKRSWR